MYAFDVHCNSYFPLFILLYGESMLPLLLLLPGHSRRCLKFDIKLCAAVVQFLFSPVLLHRNLLSSIISVLLYVVALSYYHYLNFLGYSALPFLDHTEVSYHVISVLLPFECTVFLKVVTCELWYCRYFCGL